MKITKEWLKEQGACEAGMKWFLSQEASELETIAMKLLEQEHFDWVNWGLTRLLPCQKVRYAIFAAKEVISIYESRYPEDKRPRLAIEAAEQYLEDAPKKNRAIARANAAAYAAYAARAAYAAVDAADSWILKKKIVVFGISLLKESNV